MGILGTIVIVLFVLVCILLVFFVLVQDDQGDGMGGIFGGGGGSPFAGGNKALARLTAYLGAIFMVISFVFAMVVKEGDEGNVIGEALRLSNEAGTHWLDAEILDKENPGDSLIIPEGDDPVGRGE